MTTAAPSVPSSADLEALFTSCVRKTFTNQDVKAIQQTCSRLATFCQVSSAVYDPHRKVFQDFRERYALTHGDVSAEKAKLSKKDKKKAKKDKKKAEKAKKKAKKEEKKKVKKDKKKAKKGDKKGKSKKDKKKDKKAKKEQKKKEKKEKKKAEEAKKKAKKEQKKKEKADEKARTPEEKKQHKLAKKEKKKAEKAQKQAKKEQKKLAKKAKKQEREQSKKEGKLIEQEQKLLKQEAKLAEKIRNFVLKNEQRQANLPRVKLSPSKIEKRLDEVRAALATRDTSVSRFAPCLLFTPDSGKDADSQCAVLKRASEFTLQAEECWAGYLSTLQHCKQNASKKKVKACYATFEVASARCGSLATKGRLELQKLVGSSANV